MLYYTPQILDQAGISVLLASLGLSADAGCGGSASPSARSSHEYVARENESDKLNWCHLSCIVQKGSMGIIRKYIYLRYKKNG